MSAVEPKLPPIHQTQQSLTVIVTTALLAGVISALLVIVFQRITKADLLHQIDAIGMSYNVPYLYLLLPFIALLILLPLDRRFHIYSRVGLPALTSAFHFGSGILPLGNLLYQFTFASVAIVCGFAVGAVGPALYIGAAIASLLGQKLKFKPPTLRLLCGCGAAGAMAALFNTPVAAVFLVTELVVRRWHWRILLAMSISAFTASTLSKLSGSDFITLSTASIDLGVDLLWRLVLVGVSCALVAIALNWLITYISDHKRGSRSVLWLIATLVTMVGGYYSIDTMGLGESLIKQLMYMPPDMHTNVDWLLLRFVLTAVAIGVAIPGGMLGPALVLGALLGSLHGMWLPPEYMELMILVSMAAMLGTVLGAPIAGALLISEITQHPDYILPTLLACTVASLTQRLLKQKSLHHMLLSRYQINLENSPLLQGDKNSYANKWFNWFK